MSDKGLDAKSLCAGFLLGSAAAICAASTTGLLTAGSADRKPVQRAPARADDEGTEELKVFGRYMPAALLALVQGALWFDRRKFTHVCAFSSDVKVLQNFNLPSSLSWVWEAWVVTPATCWCGPE